MQGKGIKLDDMIKYLYQGDVLGPEHRAHIV